MPIDMSVPPELLIRPEARDDASAVQLLLMAAFDGSDEASLVDRLRARRDSFAIVAEQSRSVVGVIVFSPVMPRIETGDLRAVGLAPLAVHPNHQNRGVGARLVAAGIEECRQREVGLIVVLGHASYYSRFGFLSAAAIGLRCRWSHDDESFMYLELKPGQARDAGHFVEYCPEFDVFSPPDSEPCAS